MKKQTDANNLLLLFKQMELILMLSKIANKTLFGVRNSKNVFAILTILSLMDKIV